ncbi:hypothetical protein IU450_28085 [Nocardia abscessus]|uniref:hypothetical protein n=1 Tax=Nocardia abscessus TaxID=120957 RepID=UPI0018957950|nr:hypothetical protein [Nocardia abscessus]MBF6339722.1 hypothetical protein [Nocardia abscessus]
MPTTRLMSTVLPYSVDPADPFHVSLFLSHRLEGGGQLDDYPVMRNWVSTLRGATIRLRTDTSPLPIACTPLLAPSDDPRIIAPSDTAWQTAFPADTVVRDYPQPKLTDVAWNTYPANRTPDHALDAHYASICSCPVSRPGVLGNPLAEELLDVLQRIPEAEGVSDLVRELRGYLDARDRRRLALIVGRDQAARDSVAPTKPDPDLPGPGDGGGGGGAGDGGVHLRAAEIPRGWRSPIELLLDRDDTDRLITEFLDRLLTDPEAAGDNPMLVMLRDVHAAQRYYNRPEEQRPPRDKPLPNVHPPRTPHDAPDFHERAAAACNVPALARALGFVVDVHVEDLDALRAAHAIHCDVIVDGAEAYLSPETRCNTVGPRFFAAAQTDRWTAGRLRLGDPARYRVMDLDPDAAGLALEQLLRSVIRALAVEVNGDRSSFAPAALRAHGFSIAELNRPTALRERVTKVEQLEPVVEVPGTVQPHNQFHFEDLMRGTRVEVWDDTTRMWHSLHQRRVSASFDTTPILAAVRDVGFLQNPPPSRVPGNDTNPYYVHEVLAGWHGWSLSAPRPGRHVIHDDGTRGRPGTEYIASQPQPQDGGLRVQSTAEPGSLPALRYGRRYSFRIAGVDLAGNSVPLDPIPTSEPQESTIANATAHLVALRAEAAQRDQAGLLASLRARGLAHPRALDRHGTPGEIERAMASVVDNATSLRQHPQWDVDPKQLAALFADSGDPSTISSPRLFLRWDPIPAPTLVPRIAYTTGESLQRMVIRTGLTGTPGLCERHIVPPKGSQLEAELDGRFDELMRLGNHARAYAIALKERGNLFHTRIQDLNSPTGTIAQPGISLLPTPGATDPTLDDIQNPDVQPAEGQYIAHDVDNLMLPYLADPMANGVALVFYEAGADHRFANPRVLQSVMIPYAGNWPELQPLRLVLHHAPRLDARQDGNVIHVGLPPGEQVAVTYSTTLDANHLEKMGLWRFDPVHDPQVPDADRQVIERAARDGWLWWLTPDEHLRLVHATARPAIAPAISRLTAKPRNPNVVTVDLDGVIDVHGASTEKVQLRARWDDVIDDPDTDAPTPHGTKEIVVDHRIEEHERFSLLTLDKKAEEVGNRMSEVPIRTAIHNLPDTKARTVFYRLHGSSRYREFFTPEELPPPDDARSAGNEVAVNIPSSAAPAPPVVRDVIPMFMWEQTTEPQHPFAIRRIRRSGVRIWLDRPWYSSGDGEMLAIITTGDSAAAEGNAEKVSLWARDPILVGPQLASSQPKLDGDNKPLPLTSNEVPVLPAWQQRAVQLSLDPQNAPGRPLLHVVKERKSNSPDDKDNVINAYAYRPEFHRERKRWFVDAVFDSASAIWPFLRLSVARYQPNSITGMAFSEVVPTDFVQLPPERIGTLSRPEAGQVRVTVTGVTALTNAPGLEMPTQPPDRAKLLELLPKSRQVVATLQVRNSLSGSDIDWVNVAQVPCELAGVDEQTFKATWSAVLNLEPAQQLLTPGTAQDLRAQVEEYEILSADPHPGEETPTGTTRLVYADHFYL